MNGQTLGEMLAEDEARQLAKAREEIAAEQRAWNALTPAEKAARTAEVEAKYAYVPDTDAANDDEACDVCGEPLDEETGDCPYCDPE